VTVAAFYIVMNIKTPSYNTLKYVHSECFIYRRSA